jgi:outer membrane protein OmpA-like peptidoglycan-associated protein
VRILKNLKKNPTKPSSTVNSEKRVFNFREHESDSIIPGKSDIALLEESIDEFSDVKSVLFELDEHFKFGFGSSLLTDDAKNFLDELFSFLQRNPKFKVEIVGHTDNVGKPVVNYRLSTARAKAVENYLVEMGLAKDRVKAFGAGDTQPVTSNGTDEERSKNRRVHFKIYVEQ